MHKKIPLLLETMRCYFTSKISCKTLSDYLAQVIDYFLFTSAIQVLQCVGTFACCVSALGQYVPYYQIWYTENYFSMTMLTQCLHWTLVPHKEMVYTWSWTQVVRKPSLQVAGLQVHATTLRWCCTKQKVILFLKTLKTHISPNFAGIIFRG